MPVYHPLIGIPSADHEPSPGDPQRMYGYRASYPHALAAAGAAPVVIPLNLPSDALAAIFARLDGLCLAGGVDIDPARYGEERHPALGKVDADRDATELLITRWALESGLPVLGICRGIQVLNVAAGGSLIQDIAAQTPGADRHQYELASSPWERATQTVRVEPDSLLARALGVETFPTNSFHHQAVKETAPGFCTVAWSSDGIIEGIESLGAPFVVGVQWHPEGMYAVDPVSRRLFAAFVDACSQAACRQGRG